MPYIEDQETRRKYDRLANLVATALKDNKDGVSGGELNYFICRLLVRLSPESYSDHKSNMADIQEAIHEYRRKVLVPYEERKEKENGTVWI